MMVSNTAAILQVPGAVYGIIRDLFIKAEQDRSVVLALPEGGDATAIDMDGVALVAEDDTDICINSGVLSDTLHDIGQDAFLAGWEARERVAEGPSAAGHPDDPHTAFSLYHPPEELLDRL